MIENEISDLKNRRIKIELGGGDAAIKKIHDEGKLTARERVEALFDGGTFVEVGAFIHQRSTNFNLSDKIVPADGVITGYGAVEGRLVYVYSQDVTVLGGALGEMHAKKIANIYDMALKMGAPIVALIDSAGVRLQEATDALDGFGTMFLKQSMASGVVPQITAVLGTCGGGAAIIPSLSDFVFMTAKGSKLFVNSPNALDDKFASFENYANADFHAHNTGIVDNICDTDASCIASIRYLIHMLPSNNEENSPAFDPQDDINREIESVVNYVNGGMDAKEIITLIADLHEVVQIKAAYGKEVITAFVRLHGVTVGMMGNQSKNGDGKLTGAGCDKIASFVKFCDAFNIPVVTLTDVTGFSATVAQEKAGLSKSIAQMTYAFASATVPKVNVIIGHAIGSAYVAQNSKHIGADFVYAWPSAVVSVMDGHSAVKIMYAEEIENSQTADVLIKEKSDAFEKEQGSPYQAASRGYIDDVIEPLETRKRIISALEMLYSKHVFGPDKKHGTL